jgi:hypothetical protein
MILNRIFNDAETVISFVMSQHFMEGEGDWERTEMYSLQLIF